MLKLHYTGDKPIINQSGVFFRTAKRDKYLYLPLAISILKTVDKGYKGKNHAIFIDSIEKLSDQTMLQTIKQYEPDLESHVNAEEKKYEEHVRVLMNEVRGKSYLSSVEKEIWLKNIEIMKPYLLQREINKLYYIHTIKHIKEIIYKHGIVEIGMEFDLLGWHVLRSISGNFEYGEKSVSTSIRIEVNGKKSIVKLRMRLR